MGTSPRGQRACEYVYVVSGGFFFCSKCEYKKNPYSHLIFFCSKCEFQKIVLVSTANLGGRVYCKKKKIHGIPVFLYLYLPQKKLHG